MPNPVASFFRALRPRRVRSFVEFAESEIVLPTGPRSGLPFRCDFMPWTRCVLEEFDAGRYESFFLSGPRQGGKTLVAFIIPIMYYLFEVEEEVIIGVPNIDMAQKIYDERLLPAIRRSRYRGLLPKKGAGSRGGKFTSIRFGNGVVLRFMGAGGGDEQRSSHTARVIVLTEIDTMDTAGKTSRQSDPVTQIIACSSSYNERARVFAECITTTEAGRVNQEISKYGTDTKAWVPCPHCGDYITLERDGFSGWQGVSNVEEARANATFTCPSCQSIWDEGDRLAALVAPVLATKGQEVLRDGSIDGDPPRTRTWGFRWNSLYSGLTDMAKIAEWEFRAERSENTEDMRALFQFRWALPYQDDQLAITGLTWDSILAKIGKTPRGIIPDGMDKTVLAIDLGLHVCWWMFVAFSKTAEGLVVDYGSIDVPQERQTEVASILTALREFRDTAIVSGWQGPGGVVVSPDLVFVDSGGGTRAGEAFKDAAYPFVSESGAGFLPTKGLGTAKTQERWSRPKGGKGRIIGRDWVVSAVAPGVRLVEMHTDYWKREVHRGFAAPVGAAGSLTLFKADKRDHWKLCRHLTSERQEEEFEPGKGRRVFWRQYKRDNHWFDAAYACLVGADMLGIKPITGDRPEAPEEVGTSYAEASEDYAKKDSDGWRIGR